MISHVVTKNKIASASVIVNTLLQRKRKRHNPVACRGSGHSPVVKKYYYSSASSCLINSSEAAASESADFRTGSTHLLFAGESGTHQLHCSLMHSAFSKGHVSTILSSRVSVYCDNYNTGNNIVEPPKAKVII